MNGHTYAILLAGVTVTAATFDVIRVSRRLPEKNAAEENTAAERNVGLVVVSRVMLVIFAFVLAGMLWNFEDDKHWTESKVVQATEKIAADMERGGDAPTDAGSFKSLVDEEVQGVQGNGLGLTDDWATAPAGAVESYVITGTEYDDRMRESRPTKYRACLVITSATPVPNGLPTSDPASKYIHDYAIRTKVTAGGC
ncbi:hypothetical protein BFF78_18245 [Streptomyces fodineus]|uniref:Uncharacterized protein n=1 Tax=Streptomyces fodineus TaxID=1904616 RepID=A0A1D7YAU3_9ACTN|nr:hypothetical protein [Streptomyces fodineus]AOR32747.1 hypothetical protein BFF78_18245 [Streptomyces fodineus]